MSQRKEACATCHFWDQADKLHQPEKGFCRRFPPGNSTVALPQQNAIGQAQIVIRLNQHCPTMHQDEWCGEWRNRSNIQLAS